MAEEGREFGMARGFGADGVPEPEPAQTMRIASLWQWGAQ